MHNPSDSFMHSSVGNDLRMLPVTPTRLCLLSSDRIYQAGRVRLLLVPLVRHE